MSYWQLPPSPPPSGPSYVEVLQAVAAERHHRRLHEQLLALEELVRLAMRDERSVLVLQRDGFIEDAKVLPAWSGPPCQIFYADASLLDLPTVSLDSFFH
jgi:hypothetical protein